MKKIVADSSSLILLSKCNLLELVCDEFEVVVPRSVTKETATKSLMKNYPDAALIGDLISRGIIKVEEPRPAKLQIPLSLHRGEKDALQMALEIENCVFATDDGKAVRAAKFLKVPFTITPKIVTSLFRLRKISLEIARQSIEKLAKVGRYSPEIIAESFLALMEEKDGKAHNNKDT